MQQGDLSIVSSTLHLAAKTLRQRWEDTNEAWRDAASQHFYEQHIEPIEPVVLNTLKALNRLTLIVNRARQECTEPSDM